MNFKLSLVLYLKGESQPPKIKEPRNQTQMGSFRFIHQSTISLLPSQLKNIYTQQFGRQKALEELISRFEKKVKWTTNCAEVFQMKLPPYTLSPYVFPLCLRALENLHHIFLSCLHAKKCRFHLFGYLHLNWVFDYRFRRMLSNLFHFPFSRRNRS